MNKIPKKIFFYWGGGKLSWMRYMTLYSFRKFNPEWEMTLYVSDDKKEQGWKGNNLQDYVAYKCDDDHIGKINNLNIIIKKVEFPEHHFNLTSQMDPIHKSDVFRYYKLYEKGGFYGDLDILFFRSIDKIYNDIIDKNSDTIFFEAQNHNAIGFLGSSINNEFYKNLFDNINTAGYGNYQSYGTIYINQLYNSNPAQPTVIQQINKKHPKLNVYNIPKNLVYKYDWLTINNMFTNGVDINQFDEKSIGYHWYGGHKLAQEYNNLLNENNYNNYNITFSKLIKNVKEI